MYDFSKIFRSRGVGITSICTRNGLLFWTGMILLYLITDVFLFNSHPCIWGKGMLVLDPINGLISTREYWIDKDRKSSFGSLLAIHRSPFLWLRLLLPVWPLSGFALEWSLSSSNVILSSVSASIPVVLLSDAVIHLKSRPCWQRLKLKSQCGLDTQDILDYGGYNIPRTNILHSLLKFLLLFSISLSIRRNGP
jgi:hypothetical protein